MKAMQVMAFGGPENMQLNTVPKPMVQAGEMLIAVKAAGVNPVETYIREGSKLYGDNEPPFTLGSDFSGIVEEVSAELENSIFSKGAKVFGFLLTKPGTYCEYISVDPSKEVVCILPDNCTFEQGAALPIPFFTCYKALFSKAEACLGQTILIHGGSGGVGMAAIQIAKCKGLNVLATVGTDKGKEICEASGADEVFYHNQEGYIQEIKDVVKSQFQGIDIIFENAAHFNMNKDLDLIKPGGTIIIVGARNPVETDIGVILHKEIKVHGVLLSGTAYELFDNMSKDIQDNLKNGNYNPLCISYPLSEAPLAHKEIINPSSGGANGKIVLTM